MRNTYSSPPLIHGFAYRGFSYPWSTAVQKYQIENSGNTQFISVKLHADLSRVMKSRPVPLHPTGTWLIPQSRVSTLHTLPACYSRSSRLRSQTDSWGITVFVFTLPLFYLRMGPKVVHVTFIAVHCYNCTFLSLVTGVNLFLCLMYKLSFIIGMCV